MIPDSPAGEPGTGMIQRTWRGPDDRPLPYGSRPPPEMAPCSVSSARVDSWRRTGATKVFFMLDSYLGIARKSWNQGQLGETRLLTEHRRHKAFLHLRLLFVADWGWTGTHTVRKEDCRICSPGEQTAKAADTITYDTGPRIQPSWLCGRRSGSAESPPQIRGRRGFRNVIPECL
jgi:hypothetical protein